jgi:ABC-type multidrug transport system permease subunit
MVSKKGFFKFVYRTGKTLLVLSTAALTATAAVGYGVKAETNADGVSSSNYLLPGVIIGGISFLWASYIICFSGCKPLRKTSGGFKRLGMTYILFAIAMIAYLVVVGQFNNSLTGKCFACPSCTSVGATIKDGVCTGGNCFCSQQCFSWQTGCYSSCPCPFSSSNTGSCAVSSGYNSTSAALAVSGFRCEYEQGGKWAGIGTALVATAAAAAGSFFWVTAIYFSKAFENLGDAIELDSHAPGAY